jgi:hypothetical protein
VVAAAAVAASAALVASWVPVRHDVAQYIEWFRAGAPDGVEPLFVVLCRTFASFGGYRVFFGLYATGLVGAMALALLWTMHRKTCWTECMLAGGAVLYLLSPFFIFNQALLVRQSIASAAVVAFVFFEASWFVSALIAIGVHAYGILLIALDRRALVAAAVAGAVVFLFVGAGAESAALTRKLNFATEVAAGGDRLGGASMGRYIASVALLLPLATAREPRIRVFGRVLSVIGCVAPIVSTSAVFLTRANFIGYYFAPFLSAFFLLQDPEWHPPLRTLIAGAIFVLGLYTCVASIVGMDRVL